MSLSICHFTFESPRTKHTNRRSHTHTSASLTRSFIFDFGDLTPTNKYITYMYFLWPSHNCSHSGLFYGFNIIHVQPKVFTISFCCFLFYYVEKSPRHIHTHIQRETHINHFLMCFEWKNKRKKEKTFGLSERRKPYKCHTKSQQKYFTFSVHMHGMAWQGKARQGKCIKSSHTLRKLNVKTYVLLEF